MIHNFPVLVVVLPLFSAPACVLIRNGTAVKLFAIAVAWATLAMSISLLQTVLDTGVISYHLGDWAPPLGIEYRIDHLNALLLLIVSGIASVVMPFGPGAIRLQAERIYLFYSAFLLTIAGLMGISVTGDAFNVFVFLEISSLSAYGLIALGRERRALTAAFSYLVMGTIGGTFILLGIGMLYMMTGTLNMADIHRLFPAALEHMPRVGKVAFAFLIVGVSIKLAVFPLHQWLPNAYTYAPPAVSAFLAATATKVSYYVLVRAIFGLFGAAFVFGTLRAQTLLVPLSIVAMFVGSLAAIYQADIKRLLAYSSIAQIGYMTLGLGMNSVNGLTGGLVHLFNHALMKGGLFLVVACVGAQITSTKLDDWKGLGKAMPITSAAFVIGGLGLIGVPGTVGFVSKWYLVLGAIEHGWYGVGLLILLSSLLAVVYVWRVVELLYFADRPDGAPAAAEVSPNLLIPTWILIGGSVVFGLYTPWSAGVASAAAKALMGVP